MKALIFDLDGVVINSEPLWDRSQVEFLGRRGISYDIGMKHLITGKSVVEGVRIMQDHYGFGGDPEELARERKQIVGTLFANELAFVDGFLDFFKRYAAYPSCIATALDAELVAIADRRLGLSALFHRHIYTIADVGMRSKPNPDVFLYGARQLGVLPASCVVIEDSPFGIEAAHRAGMPCIGITTTYDREMLRDAHLVATGYDEITLCSME
jgi:beta-phosphoglucomutase